MGALSSLAQTTDYYTTTTNDTSTGGAVGAMLWALVSIVLIILVIAGGWRTFQKAKKPGWAIIIPFYNVYTMIKMAGRPGWWLLLNFIPVVNLVVGLIVALDIAKAFGKTGAFGVFGLWLFAPIGYLILGFGNAKYKGVPKH